MGAVALGLLFRGKGGDLVEEPSKPEQLPSAVDVVARPQYAFFPECIAVPAAIAPLFVIEDIMIGAASQFAASADAMSPALLMEAAAHGSEIRFRVRYVGDDPRGARFYALIIGRLADSRGKAILPIDSGVAIVA